MSDEADEMIDRAMEWADSAERCPRCGSRFVDYGFGCPVCEEDREAEGHAQDNDDLLAALEEAQKRLRGDADAMPRDILVPPLKVALSLADALATTSPKFDRDRFLRACVPGANVRASAQNANP